MMGEKEKNRLCGAAGALLLAGAALIFAAPGGIGSGSGVSSGSTGSGRGDAETDGSSRITVGVFSDSYWEVPNGYAYEILEDAIRIFEEENSGVQVEYVSGIMKEDYSEWLAEQVLSGTAPDVFLLLGEDFNDYAEQGVLMDLDPFMEQDESFDRNGFYSSALSAGRYRQNQYALPYECAPRLMFVNKTILDREGVEMPGEDWTWEDFYQICRKVTKDTNGDGVTDQFGVVGYTWEEAFDSNGVTIFDQTGTECFLTGSRVEEAIRFIERLEEIDGGNGATERDFDLGNVAFWPMVFSEFRAYKSYPLSVKKYSGFEWSCIPMPAGPEGGNISSLDTLLAAVSGKTRHREEAWEFLKILTCDERIQSELFDYSEGVSVLKNVTESEENLKRLIEDSETLNLQILSDAVENAAVSPRFRGIEEAKAEVGRAVDDIISSGTSISTGQIIWNREINKFLAGERL